MSVIVYTTIFGGSDSLKPAPVGADRCVCFTDRPWDYQHSLGWEMRVHQAEHPRREAWHLRCIPHELFESYDRVVWIDASFHLIDLPSLLKDAGSAPIAALRHHERNTPYYEAGRLVGIGQANKRDIDRQVVSYQRAGFEPTHLSISCLIVRDRSDAVIKFNLTWDKEIQTHPGDNTQVSLDYSAWVHGLTIKGLTGTRHQNPYAVHDHLDHRTRRQPYDVECVQ